MDQGQECVVYRSVGCTKIQMFESRGLSVLCLVTLKINKCETVTLKSLFVRCVQLKPICGTELALQLTLLCDFGHCTSRHLHRVQATWHCSIQSCESIRADQRAGLQFTSQHNNFDLLPSDISRTAGQIMDICQGKLGMTASSCCTVVPLSPLWPTDVHTN